jgi:AcrR family transcriptional regulator
MTDKVTKSERTRQRILDAAAAVFRESGYANARLVDIAERAGMQTGSLYYHFDSREVLVEEILRLGIEIAWAHVRAAVDGLGEGADPVEKLAAAVHAHTMAVLEISDYASAQTRIVGPVTRRRSSGPIAHWRRYFQRSDVGVRRYELDV